MKIRQFKVRKQFLSGKLKGMIIVEITQLQYRVGLVYGHGVKYRILGGVECK
jgi:hypothetical protein